MPRLPTEIRKVAVPAEHGGWGLTLEPALLGLLVAPSAAGFCLAFVGLLAFVSRTPLKLALVDRRRHRHLERTRLATRIASIEIGMIVMLVVAAAVLTEHAFWVPAVIAAPLILIELSYDIRSRSRRLVPELAGPAGIAGLAAIIGVAGGASATTAAAIWLILVARAVTSIPFVRSN